MHALFSTVLAVWTVGHFQNNLNKTIDTMTLKLTEMVSLAVGCYCGVFCLALAGFFLYTVDLASRDITSNESIRKKWNG